MKNSEANHNFYFQNQSFFALIDMKHETDLFLFYDLTPSRIEIHVAMFSQQKPCLDRGGLTAPPQTCHVDIHTW